MNNSGQILFASDETVAGPNRRYGVVYEADGEGGFNMTDIGNIGLSVEGTHSVAAEAINNLGWVVGSTTFDIGGTNENRAFLWTNDLGMIDLNSIFETDPGYTLNLATAVNDSGQIVARGNNNNLYILDVSVIPPPPSGTLISIR